MRRRLAFTAAAAALLLVAAGCGDPARNADSPESATFRLAAGASGPFGQNYNPLIVSGVSTSGYSADAIFEPLLQENFGDGTTTPWLVTAYTFSDDGLKLTLTTREGVKWSDGQDFSAEDVAYTFTLLRDNPALNATGLPIKSATATDAHTVVLEFTKPSAQIMWWRTMPVPEHLWKSVPDPVKYTNQNPVGTGPYKMESFTPQVVTLTKNENYWQQGKPVLPKIQYLSFDSTSSMVAALQTGAVNWIGATGTDGGPIKKAAPDKIDYWSTKLNPGVVILVPNLTNPVLAELPVRQAMDKALDRNLLSSVGTGGLNEPVASPTALDLGTRGKLIAPEYADLRYGAGDPAAASAVLDKAGYTKGSDGVYSDQQGRRLSFQMTVPSAYPQADMVKLSKIVVEELGAAGIEVKVNSLQQNAWKESVELGQFQLTMRSNGGTPAVWDFYNRIFNQDGVKAKAGKKTQLNYEKYDNPKAGELMTQYSAATPGSPAEAKALQGIQQLMVQDLPVLPLLFTSGVGLWRTDVVGFPTADNPYAVPVPGSINAELVLLELKPKSAT